MRKALYAAVAAIAALLLCSAVVMAQPKSRGGWGNWGYESRPERQWNYCPECGRPWGPYGGYGMDPRGRWGNDHRMEPGLEGRSYGPGPGPSDPEYDYGPYNPGYENPPYQRERRKPLDKSNARRTMENYLDYTGNPNLKLGEIHEKDGVFEAEIVTKKEGSLVDKVIIDKRTGRVRSIY